MQKLSFMIVDDHEIIRWALRNFLSADKSYEVVAETGSGEQALILAQEKRPDFVFLDINMQPASGFEILKGIRKLSPLSRIIGFSMHSQPMYARKMIRLGAKGYLTKNASMAELEHSIGDILSGKIYISREIKDKFSRHVLEGEDCEPDIDQLSERETQVIQLLREGHSSKSIGVALAISANTAEVHRSNILKKLKLKNTAALMHYMHSTAFDA